MDGEQKKTTKTILIVALFIVGVALAAWSGYRNLAGPKEEIAFTIPPGADGAGMNDREKGKGAEASAPSGQGGEMQGAKQ